MENTTERIREGQQNFQEDMTLFIGLPKQPLLELSLPLKLKCLCFATFALFLEFGTRTLPHNLWPFLISETGLKFLIWTHGEIKPGQPGSCEEALSLQ